MEYNMPETKKSTLDSIWDAMQKLLFNPIILLPLMKPIVSLVVKKVLLEPLMAKDPKLCAMVANEFYVPVDVFAEDYAKTTETPLDDAAVKAVMECIEEFAKENAFTLANVDGD